MSGTIALCALVLVLHTSAIRVEMHFTNLISLGGGTVFRFGKTSFHPNAAACAHMRANALINQRRRRRRRRSVGRRVRSAPVRSRALRVFAFATTLRRQQFRVIAGD